MDEASFTGKILEKKQAHLTQFDPINENERKRYTYEHHSDCNRGRQR